MFRTASFIVLKWVAPLLLIAVAAGFAVFRLQGDQLLSVQTGSMIPAIRPGDLLVVDKVSASELSVGDVVTFRSAESSSTGMSVTHRIIELPGDTNGNTFITKGDANPTADQPLRSDAIIGKVHLSLPFAGYLLNFLRNPLGLLLIIYVPALFIVVEEIKRLSRYYERQRPWRDVTHPRFKARSAKQFLVLMAVGIVVFSTTTTYATLATSAQLTSNTIVATRPTQGPTDCVPASTTNSESVTVQGTSNGGSAESGSVRNCNSTNIRIIIRNN